MPGPLGREEHRGLVMMVRTAFPDWSETVEDVVETGKIAEGRAAYDALGLLQQLGAVRAGSR